MISKQQIKHIRSLQQKKYRDDSAQFVVEGLKMVREAILQIPAYIVTIVATEKTRKFIDADLLAGGISELIIVGQVEYAKLTGQKNPQQILAVISQNYTSSVDNTSVEGLILGLDRIQDPGNFGTIVRLADWFGIERLLCTADTVDCFNPKAVQATMGAIFRCEIEYTLSEAKLADLRAKGYVLCVSSLDGTNVYETRVAKPAVVLLGNESSGISKGFLAMADQHLFIPNFSPMKDKTESLNVSIAAAIICSEFIRGEKSAIQS